MDWPPIADSVLFTSIGVNRNCPAQVRHSQGFAGSAHSAPAVKLLISG
jgi:hypothetical protein